MYLRKIRKLSGGALEKAQLQEQARLALLKGADGKDGKDGIDGKPGVDGINGFNGKDGRDGKDGNQGPQGLQGISGNQGPQGPPGKNGKNGEDGRGIAKMWVDNAGYLWVKYTDGQDERVGYVEGKQGPPGPRGQITNVIGFPEATTAPSNRTIVNTSTTEEIEIINDIIVRQTEQNITTSFSTPQEGAYLTVKNDSLGTNTLSLTLDGCVNPLISAGESYHIAFDGVDWMLL